MGKMTDRFIAFYHFDRKFIHGVVELLFNNEFYSSGWLPHILVNMISTHCCIVLCLHPNAWLISCCSFHGTIHFQTTTNFKVIDNCLLKLDGEKHPNLLNKFVKLNVDHKVLVRHQTSLSLF